MPRKRRLIPAGLPPRLLWLLFAYFEWRAGRESPRGGWLPEPRFAWRWAGNALVAGSWSGPGGRWRTGQAAVEPMIPCTAPKGVGPLEEFGYAFGALPEAARAVLAGFVANCNRPWPPRDEEEGEGWTGLLQALDLGPGDFEKALLSSFELLGEAARTRGLIG